MYARQSDYKRSTLTRAYHCMLGAHSDHYSEIVVPTTDSVRTTYLLDLLAPRGQHVLLCGPTGTGKTINISQYLMGQVSHACILQFKQ
jgi:transcriptional regulator with AAA-type ATPase domain